MGVITPRQVRTHARRSVLTKAIGLGLFVQPDVFSVELRPGDRLILTSDGVWAMFEDEEICEIAAGASGPAELCRQLIDLALERDSDDNVSAIAVFFEALSPPRLVSKNEGWFKKLWNRKA
jgi:PPM family protein phosphatase